MTSPVAGADMRDVYAATHCAVRGQAPGHHAADEDVHLIALGVPFELTLSCMNPQSEIRNPKSAIHCGLGSKCRERHDAFIELGVADPTEYEDQRYVRA